MIHEQYNLGFIFNQLPNLLAKGMNCFTSESDLLVKLARELRQDHSITHDKSIFRKIRNSEANYDLYRIDEGVIVEHWDTVEKIPPASEWKNDNGKF